MILVIGGGPAGLIAAETLSRAGRKVELHDRMSTFGRKLLMAGRGGLNLTHSEALENFLGRYGPARDFLSPAIRAFPPAALRDWAAGLGQETFVGSSGRIFPKTMKASPLLRAWLGRLREQGVALRTGSAWLGWDSAGRSEFQDQEPIAAEIVILALGGASWPRLGSDGAWTEILARRGVAITPQRPANCGFKTEWSPYFRDRYQGQPIKNLALSFAGKTVRGEIMISAAGIEGGAVYALSAALRDTIERDGRAVLEIDLCPHFGADDVAKKLAAPRRGQSQSNHLRRTLGLSPVAINLLRETGGQPKAAPLTLTALQSLDRAISTAGGIALDELDRNFMLKRLPGVFAAGEMLDWEAPTGGYLLQACFASGVAAAQGALAWLGANEGVSY